MKKLSERVWQKFHPIFGPDLKVGFETTFPKGAVLNLDPFYEKSGLVHKPPKEKVMRIYEPARVMGSCCDGGEKARILFVPVSQKGALFRRLVFARKIGDDAAPHRWLTFGRHAEVTPFGFDSWNSRDQRYLALVYPGADGEFSPTFVKIDANGNFVYLELGAYDDEVQVLFSADRVCEDAVPKHLLLAMPGA